MKDCSRDLSGRVALVTGAARGLGRAYALRLASLGAKVAVADLDHDSYADFAQEAEPGSTVEAIVGRGGEALAVKVDVTDPAAVNAMAAEVVEHWGSIDILVANAGGTVATAAEAADPMTSRPTAATVSPEVLATVVQRNLNGTVHTCTAVAPFMISRGWGKIVTVGSYTGSVADRDGYGAHYGATKAAIAAYTRYLAQELGPHNINVNCISPGFIATGRIMAMTGGQGIDKAQIALRRFGTPDDCADVVEFLCTDQSGYVTGAVIPVNGGWNPGPT